MSDEVTFCAGHWLALVGDGCWALVQLGAGDPRVDAALAALRSSRPVDALASTLAAETQGAPGFAIVGREGSSVHYAVRAPAKITAVVDEVPIFVDGISGHGEWTDGHFEVMPERAELANGAWGGMEMDEPLTGMAPARSVDVVFDPAVGAPVSPAASPAPAAPPSFDYTRQRPAGGWDTPPPEPEPEAPPLPRRGGWGRTPQPPAPVVPPAAAPPPPEPSPQPSHGHGLIDGLPWRRKGAGKSDAPWPEQPPPARPPAPPVPWQVPAEQQPVGPPPPATPTPTPTPTPEPTPPVDDGRTRVRGSAPATPTPTPPPAGPSVWAVHCARGHASPPYSPRCRICGDSLPPHQQPVAITRPPLGKLTLSTGPVVALDRGVVLGRSPRADESQPGVPPHLLKILLADISRLHTEVRLEDWQVLVRDLGSANGTYLTLPGGQPQQLRTMEEYALEPGSIVSLAGTVTFTYEVE